MKIMGEFLTFIFYSFLGYIFEILTIKLQTKKLVNRGYLNGPIIPVYGIGSLLIITASKYLSSNLLFNLVSITLLSIILEYFTSFILEKIFHLKLWDYSKEKFNLNGRICLKATVTFIILALLIIYLIEPIFIKILSFLSIEKTIIIFSLSLITFLLDIVFSTYVLFKYTKYKKTKTKDKTLDIRKFTIKFINS